MYSDSTNTFLILFSFKNSEICLYDLYSITLIFLSLIVVILLGGGSYFVVNKVEFLGEVFTVGKLFAFVGYFFAVVDSISTTKTRVAFAGIPA